MIVGVGRLVADLDKLLRDANYGKGQRQAIIIGAIYSTIERYDDSPIPPILPNEFSCAKRLFKQLMTIAYTDQSYRIIKNTIDDYSCTNPTISFRFDMDNGVIQMSIKYDY